MTRIAFGGRAVDIGGKAAALARLQDAGFPVPAWFAVTDATSPDDPMPAELGATLSALGGHRFAVRSSAVDEDGAAHSFAGQFETWLQVPAADVPHRIRDLWLAARVDRVRAYRRQHNLSEEGPLPAALVQRMLDPQVAGVAFSADPVSGRRGVAVVAAVYGLGTSLVGGDADADTFHVSRSGDIVDRHIALKSRAERPAASGVEAHEVDPALAAQPALTDAQVLEVARLARAAEAAFGSPQDIEWAMQDGTLYLLQSRPITSLSALPDPDGELTLWDNSNIAESYGGITTPLTFSFARYVYEHVYREFCRMLRVSDAGLLRADDALRSMLGLIRGRVYYNMVSWYRVLALLPGYNLNRPFMEQMMGVKEGIPEEISARIARDATGQSRWADRWAVVRMVRALIRTHRGIDASVSEFTARLDHVLNDAPDLTTARPDELVTHFRSLERALLTRWDAPLANDFLAMIFYGILRKVAVTWAGDTNGTLQNDLVGGEGSVISAEPARRIVAMAASITTDDALIAALTEGDLRTVRTTMATRPAFKRAFDDYLDRFGDRCLEELKLETMTLNDDPLLLARSVGRLAQSPRTTAPASASQGPSLRSDAEVRAFDAIGSHPVKHPLFSWVLRHARHRIRDRENLRFERTRVFGRVRRIFVELGKRYASLGVLDDPRDVFYLTVDEALGWPGAGAPSSDLRALASARKQEFETYQQLPAPPDRFETRGTTHQGWLERRGADEAEPVSGDRTQGIGCYPGVVRGPVRVVRDPRDAVLQPGEILVAERTDPGWVMLFPAASGLLVERGSLLSHSAIVARELALPAVVSVAGLTTWLTTGDEVEFDGRTGVIVRLRQGVNS